MELQKNFENLKTINQEFLKNIKSEGDEEDSQVVVRRVFQELKAKNRVRFSCFFWFSFYYFGSLYVSKSFEFGRVKKYLFLAFFFVPNIYYYNLKFKEINLKIEKELINHHLSNYVVIKDDIAISLFLSEYLNFIKNKKII